MVKLLLLLILNVHLVLSENCSLSATCYGCIVAHSSCYWCTSSSSSINGCLKFNNDVIADILCPSLWIHSTDMCPEMEDDNSQEEVYNSNVETLPETTNQYDNDDNSPSRFILDKKKSKGSELKDLLHKLLLLKLLRKIKNNEGGLTEQEKSLLYKLGSKTRLKIAPKTTTTTTTTEAAASKTDNVNIELSELLKILRHEAERKLHNADKAVSPYEQGNEVGGEKIHNIAEGKLKTEIALLENVDVKTRLRTTVPREIITAAPSRSPKLTQNKFINKPITTDQSKTISNKLTSNPVIEKKKSTNLQHLENVDTNGKNRMEEGGVKYEEKLEESLEELANRKSLVKHFNKTLKPSVIRATEISATTTSSLLSYCKLYNENINLCNSDHNCTWCNTMDTCMKRSNQDYQTCVKNVNKMVDKEFGLDRCFQSKHCKQCVEDDKCYWCDTSQRCHTYPFFGYVPNSCGGDWYVKQCDVQLAVIIVVLPLIIILLGMVTFYFCLKYCHYRQKILRVPLFEKPGIFDYRKDKKVYFVNPEDESSDDELAKEKMRKKYRLPIEKEPLIDPNT